MENKEKIEKLKAIENEVRGILQGGNRRIKPELLGSYRTLLHKTRIERLTLQIESLIIKSDSGKKPANTILDGKIQVRPGIFNSDVLQKNLDQVQKSLVEDFKKKGSTKVLDDFRKKKSRKK